MTPEFEALGISLQQRGSLTNECIAIMKELWTSPDPVYHSRRWHFADLKFSPKPVQKPHIPLWIGGSSPGALKRAATMGNGWHPSGISAEDYSMGRREIQELAKAAGRDPESLTWSARVEVEAHGAPSSDRAASRARIPGDDPEKMIAGIAAYQNAGVEHIVLALNTGDVGRLTEIMDTIAWRVSPEFR
jgi:alkanesulfonate monooxygenase SsuD/methylene tetrahydromethanopterin reductase-like flavin-dependent oxidoreductase (luciferase family)